MFPTFEGLDHVVVMVRDLGVAAQQWRGLGFTVSPRGIHSAHLGTGNHTILFEDDYVELLGVLTATAFNQPGRAFLERRGAGVECVALRSGDARAGVEVLQRQGIAAQGPIDFSRPVRLPDGRQVDAAFSIINWPLDERPGDLRLFACQHHTPDAVWIPSLTSHANTAYGIRRVEIVAPDPGTAAQAMARLTGAHVERCGPGYQLETGAGRASMLFLTTKAFLRRHPGGSASSLPSAGAVALALRVKDLDAAARCTGQRSVRSSSADIVCVPADHAAGVMLLFEAD